MVAAGRCALHVPQACLEFGQIGRFHGVLRADPVVLAREAQAISQTKAAP